MVMSNSNPRRPSAERLNNIVRLTSDLSGIQSREIQRLRGLLVSIPERSAQREELTDNLVFGGSLSRRLTALEPDDALRELVAATLPDEINPSELPLHALRRDSRDDLLSARLAGPLAALGGAERIGPFELDDRTIVFDIWRPATRFEITESGVSTPAFVLSSAMRPISKAREPLST